MNQPLAVTLARTRRPASRRLSSRIGGRIAALAAAGTLAFGCAASAAGVVVPAPAVDPPSHAGSETAVLSGGCFWGVQGVFEHVAGVQRAVSGYAGGVRGTAQYETVSSGATGHAESVEITFDPRQVSYGTILQIFFSVVHDPTEVNRQGPDTGTQYRSAIWTTTPEQARVARAYVAQLDAAKVYGRRIATQVAPLTGFYPAEGYHQDYLVRHPHQPYIAFNDIPKVEALHRRFPALWREQPVLVGATNR